MLAQPKGGCYVYIFSILGEGLGEGDNKTTSERSLKQPKAKKGTE